MSASGVNGFQTPVVGDNPQRSWLETIAYKKVNEIGLDCIECLVHYFLSIFSCFYPCYERIYAEEVTKKSEEDARVQRVAENSVVRPSASIENAPPTHPALTATAPISIEIEPEDDAISEISELNLELEKPSPVASPVIVVPKPGFTPILRGGHLLDATGKQLAGLSEAIPSGDGKPPYQYLVVMSNNFIMPKVKVALCFCEGDQPVRTHLDLTDGDVVKVEYGVGLYTITITKQGGCVEEYMLDTRGVLFPIDYKNPTGEKVYIAVGSAEWNIESFSECDEKLRQKLSQALPNLIPPGLPLPLQAPKR